RELWAQIDALDGKAAEATQIDALMTIWQLLRSMSRWLLSRPGPLPEIALAMSRYGDGLKAVRAALPDTMSSIHREAFDASLGAWKAKGLPTSLATQLAALPLLQFGCDIVEIAKAHKVSPVEAAKGYFHLGAALHLPWLYEQIEALPVDGRWQALARSALRDELSTQQRALVSQILGGGGKKPVEAKIEAWLQRDDQGLQFTMAMLNELMSQKTLDYPTASVAVRRLAQIAAAGG
ncbi:MAG: NAD-glutamate dehydrogenase, partial [Luteimonas sp.]